MGFGPDLQEEIMQYFSDNIDIDNDLEEREQAVQRGVQNLEHACRCTIQECPVPFCQQLQRFIYHVVTCRYRANGGCPLCLQMRALSAVHARNCHEENPNCPMPYCTNSNRIPNANANNGPRRNDN